MKGTWNVKKILLVLLPAFLLALAGIAGVVKTNAGQTQAAEVLYGVVTDISGDAYTLALGERAQSTVVASSAPAKGDTAPQETGVAPKTEPAAQDVQGVPQATTAAPTDAASTAAPQATAAAQPAAAQTDSDFLFQDDDFTIVRTGVTTTLHITEKAQVVMRIDAALVETDVQRIAVGHVVKLYLDADGGVQRVEIIE